MVCNTQKDEPPVKRAGTIFQIGLAPQSTGNDVRKVLCAALQGDAAVRIELAVALLTPSDELNDLIVKLPDWLNVAPMVSFQSVWTF